MKNLRLHGIYLSIIGVLCFQLWSKTAATRVAFEQVDEVLRSNSSFFDSHSEYLFRDIEKQAETNPLRYKPYFDAAKQTREASKLSSNFIDKMSISIQNHVNLDLKTVKDSLNYYSKSLTNIQDKQDSLSFLKKYSIIKTIQNDSFWISFKENEQSHLLKLKNQFQLDEILYLTYIQDKVSGRMHTDCNDCFRVAIAPKKAAIIEGEKFEADIYLGKYGSYPNEYLIIAANDQILPVKDGVAHYSITEENVGLKRIKAQISIYNPFTGATKIIKNEFEYHVLPKCSKNCQ